jgi:hypothetical protein
MMQLARYLPICDEPAVTSISNIIPLPAVFCKSGNAGNAFQNLLLSENSPMRKRQASIRVECIAESTELHGAHISFFVCIFVVLQRSV